MSVTQIKNRFTDAVIFEAEVDGETESIRLGLALQLSLKNNAYLARANLAGADLTDANLAGAYLARANLAGADLTDANLAGAYLARANLADANLARANLAGAYLAGANLADANLARANLAGAYLAGAYLAGAYLAGAYLAGADLTDANLAGAYLAGAKGINKYLTTPLYLLFDQPGKIRAYKVVLENGEGIYSRSQGYTPIVYRVGETYKVENASTNEQEHCAAGISLATLDWCIKEWELGRRIMVAEFSRKDIACIPIGSDGKFRVHSCKIVGEKDLKELGLVKDEVDGDHE